MLFSGKSHIRRLAYAGCSCHNPKKARRATKKMLKQREREQWKKNESRDN